MSIFCGVTGTPVWTSPFFQARVDPLLARFFTCVILRFTSGATPADCTEATLANPNLLPFCNPCFS